MNQVFCGVFRFNHQRNFGPWYAIMQWRHGAFEEIAQAKHHACTVADQVLRHILFDAQFELNRALLGSGNDALKHPRHTFAQLKFDRFECDFAGLQFGEIQQPRDGCEGRLRRHFHAAEMLQYLAG